MSSTSTLIDALAVAMDLHRDGLPIPLDDHSPRSEYLRGQSELICGMFGISTDDKAAVSKIIANGSGSGYSEPGR